MIPKGTVCRVKEDTSCFNSGTRLVVNNYDGEFRENFCTDLNGVFVGVIESDNLEPLSGLEAIKTGDVLVNREGDIEKTVLGCCGEVVFLSDSVHDRYWSGETRVDIDKQGLRPKSAPSAKRPGYAYNDKDEEIGRIEDVKIIR